MVKNKGSNIRYHITFSDWVIDYHSDSRKYHLWKCDNHIPWDDIFDYHPIRERNIYIIFPICFCQRETFSFFTNLINSKLISELVPSDKTVFLCNNATQV